MSRYGGTHQALRKRLLASAPGSTCTRCGRVIAAGDAIDLDHVDGRDDAWAGWAHASCNRRAGQERGQQLRRQRERANMVRTGWTEQAVGVEISNDRLHTSIVVAGITDGATVFELVGYLDGTDTATIVADVVRERTTVATVLDPRSPGATLIGPLTAAGVKVLEPSSHDVAVAHGHLIDELRAGRLRFAAHPALDLAAQHALARPLAGAEALERRKVDGDTSPLIAAELAVWALLRRPPVPPPGDFINLDDWDWDE